MYEILSEFTGNGVTVFCLVSIVILLTLLSRRRRGLPPGPPSLPLIGCLGQFNPRRIDEDLRRFHAKYGDIFSVMIFNRPIVFLCGYQNVHALYLKQGEISSEKPPFIFSEVMAKGHGIVANNGQAWKEQRTFALTTLRSFGYGKRSIENKILSEIDVLVDSIDKTNGKPFVINDTLCLCVSNVICSITLGKQYDHDDQNFLKLLNMIQKFLHSTGISNAASIIPLLRHFPGDLFGIQQFLKNFKNIKMFLRDIVEEHKQTFDENYMRDYIDVFLLAQRKHSDDPESTFTDDQLLQTITYLFIAGTDTTTTTINWAVLYLILNPTVQDKMRKEIVRVVGTSRRPSMNDKPELPYCEAVVTEVQRCASITATGGAHRLKEDIIFKGFLIPRDAIVFTYMESILKDPETFPEPYTFNPKRFVNEDGKFEQPIQMMPFGIGRRRCLGEQLAKAEVFLFIVSLIQKFELLPENDESLPSLQWKLGIVRAPVKYRIRAMRRK